MKATSDRPVSTLTTGKTFGASLIRSSIPTYLVNSGIPNDLLLTTRMAARMDCAVNTVIAVKKANTTQIISGPTAALSKPVPNLIVTNIIT